MARDEHGLIINAKAGILTRRIRLDFRGAIAALITTGNPLALLGLVKVELTEESLAWILIFRALNRTTLDIGAEGLRKAANREASLYDLRKRVKVEVTDEIIHVGPAFFREPADLRIVSVARDVVCAWLEEQGVGREDVDGIMLPFQKNFTAAVSAERLRGGRDYGPLLSLLDGGFGASTKVEDAWLGYARRLMDVLHEPLFDTEVRLDQVYVPLRAYWDEAPGTRRRGAHKAKTKRTIVDLETALRQWLEGGDSRDAVRIVSGGPGYGKSSCLMAIAAKLAGEGRRVLFIELHEFDPGESLRRTIDERLGSRLGLPEGPLESLGPDDRLTLIFDGLDELAMQGKGGEAAADRFIRKIKELLKDFNQDHRRADVIIAGREMIVEAHKGRFDAHQVLHLMPYFLTQEMKVGAWSPGRVEVEEQSASRDEDQRTQWWKTYSRATGIQPPGKHSRQSGRGLSAHLEPLTAVPLLNHLIAWVHSSRRDRDGGPHLDPNASRNDLYAILIEEVWERRWAREGPHPAAGELECEDFVGILEEIALAMWHAGKARGISIDGVRAACAQSGLAEKLAILEADARHGPTNLLTMFYFRRKNKEWGEDTFEFTHRTFGEYLLACRLRREIDSYAQQAAKGVGTADLLGRWLEIAGATPIDGDMLGFLRDELLRGEGATPEARRHVLEGLFDHVIEPHKEAMHWDAITRCRRHAEEALFVILRETWRIPWPAEHSLDRFIKRMRFGMAEGERIEALAHLDGEKNGLQGVRLAHADLRGINFHDSDLRDADLSHADLTGATLLVSDLRNATLDFAILERTYADDATFDEASLRHAHMQSASFEGASFASAKLHGVYARGFIFASNNFTKAVLERADLEGVTFMECSAKGADFSGANMRKFRTDGGVKANFDGAVLSRADLRGAMFRNAHFKGADFTGANLEGADFTACDMEGAIMTEEHLAQIVTDETTTLPDGTKGPYRPKEGESSDVG